MPSVVWQCAPVSRNFFKATMFFCIHTSLMYSSIIHSRTRLNDGNYRWVWHVLQSNTQRYFWSQSDCATNSLQSKVFVLLWKGRSGLCRPLLLPPRSAHSKANSILYRLPLQAGAKSSIQFQQTSLALIELVSTLRWWMSCDVFIYFGGLYRESTKSRLLLQAKAL